VDSELVQLADEALALAATHAAETVGSLTSLELRRLLTVYSTLPFKADELVNAIEEEGMMREASLTSPGSSELGQELLRSAASEARVVLSALGGDAGGGSALSAIKNGFRSMFGQSDAKESSSRETAEVEDEETPDESLHLAIERVLQSVIESANYLDVTGNARLETSQRLKDGSLFELGRCRELIAHYRRRDFDSGTSNSRFDQERRRDMVKFVLSRLNA